MKCISALALLVVSLALSAGAQTNVDTEAVKRMTVFIYSSGVGGVVDQQKPLGTGFLVASPRKGQVTQGNSPGVFVMNGGEIWLVTARHVVNPSWAGCNVAEPPLIYIRVNKKTYDPTKDLTGVDYIPVPLFDAQGNKVYFVRADDDLVDAAAVPLKTVKLSQDDDDYAPIALAGFASPDEVSLLRIGDPVVSAGLLPGKSGEKRNYPFFKFGNISNIPDEPVKTGCGNAQRLERAWFVAANLVGGNSGSPIMFDPNPLCSMSGFFHCTRPLDRWMIIGIQSSSFADPLYGNQYLSAMTPIEDVYKIIEQHSSPEMDLYRGGNAKHFASGDGGKPK